MTPDDLRIATREKGMERTREECERVVFELVPAARDRLGAMDVDTRNWDADQILGGIALVCATLEFLREHGSLLGTPQLEWLCEPFRDPFWADDDGG